MPSGSSKPTRHAPTGEISVPTERRTQLLDVTAAVARLVKDAGVQSGVCYLYVPHTTAGVLINESDDPDVAADIEAALARLVPPGSPAHAGSACVGVERDAGYRHAEGNSDSHIKTALVGTSATIFISSGELDLGRWQGIFFCEFDGPRERRLRVKIVPD
jgi:secondary thiamine-phosphate synthase enzyme